MKTLRNIVFSLLIALTAHGQGSLGSASKINETTVGGNLMRLTNPSAITFPRINADNSVDALSAAAFLTAIGGGTGNGTVTAVSVATANGISGSSSGGATPALTLILGAITPSSVSTGALTSSALTSGRVPFATTAGLLTDASTLTFNSGTGALTATTFIGALTGTASGNAATGANADITSTTALNTITAASTTNLSLNAGSSGATLSLGQGTNGSTTLTAKGSGTITEVIGSKTVMVKQINGTSPVSVNAYMLGNSTGSASGYSFFDGPDNTNAAYLAFACVTASGSWFPGAGYNTITAGKNGTGTQLPTLIGGYNGSLTGWMKFATNGNVGVGSGIVMGFTSSGDATGTLDTAFSRNAAGVVEVNSGTKGTLKNIIAETHVAGGAATSCTGATIGSGSKNNAGFVTATTTGASTIVITFSFTATTGWSVIAFNGTTVANLITQTAGNTTTATLTGTTVSGDVIRYVATPY